MEVNKESQEPEGQELAEGIVEALGKLAPGAIIEEAALARLFDRHSVSVKRAVQRGELPPPTRLFGKPVWTVKAILEHIENRLQAAKQEAEKLNRRISQLSG